MADLDFTRRAPVLHHWARRHYCGGDLPHISCDHRRLSGSCAPTLTQTLTQTLTLTLTLTLTYGKVLILWD